MLIQGVVLGVSSSPSSVFAANLWKLLAITRVAARVRSGRLLLACENAAGLDASDMAVADMVH